MSLVKLEIRIVLTAPPIFRPCAIFVYIYTINNLFDAPSGLLVSYFAKVCFVYMTVFFRWKKLFGKTWFDLVF